MRQSEKVPTTMQERYQGIIKHTDNLCRRYLNQEYSQLAHYATAALCRKRPSPLLNTRVKAENWACGILYALGSTNYLFSKDSKPYMSAGALCDHFGLSGSTVSGMAKRIKDMLKMSFYNLDWLLPSLREEHPFNWLIELNGLIVDIRDLPAETQQELHNLGIIAHLPPIDNI